MNQDFMSKLEDVKGFFSDDPRFEEIRKKKYADMKRKEEEILRTRYNFSKRQ